MMPLPAPFGSGELRFWRLDAMEHAATWDSGEGSYRVGGRWNSPGRRVVYAALDPATAILEVAVHKTFRTLDTVSHVLTSARIVDTSNTCIIEPRDVPNANWLVPGAVGAGQRAFGDHLLQDHPFILIPSVVSRHSWNIVFTAKAAFYKDAQQEPFALDPRLHPENSPP